MGRDCRKAHGNAGGRPSWSSIALACACLVTALSAVAVPAGAGATTSRLFAGARAAGDADCTSVANACTLDKALDDVRAGEIVELVTPGSQGTPSSYYAAGSSGFAVGTAGTSATSPVTIEPAPGVQAPILDGDGKYPVLRVEKGMHLAISGLDIQDGSTEAKTAAGGITNNSRAFVSVTNSTFSDNFAPQDGGAIENGPGGTLTAANSTFRDNSACLGGAIANGYGGSGTATITRSTFSANRGFCQGGAIANGNGGTGDMTVSDATFSDNIAPDGAAIVNGDGGSGKLTITGSTFSGNSASGDGATIDSGDGGSKGASVVAVADIISGSCLEASGSWIDLGDNVASSTSCLKGGNGDTPKPRLSTFLGSLADNGGPTLTMALLPGNPAVGLIPNPTSGLCPVTADQTGRPGPTGAPCNAGALQPHPLISTVAFSRVGTTPTVTISGTGFGTEANLGAPTLASTCAGGPATGDDYASNLYLSELNGKWGAGQGPPAACDYYGLLISQYSATRIVFTLGSEYPTYGRLKLGNYFKLHVLGAGITGVVASAPAITRFQPPSGRVGTIVTVEGTSLSRARVTFNGVTATVSQR